jgi:protein arginine N-methyltransferase 5
MASQRNPLNVGIDLPHVVDLRESLANEVQNDGFDFVAVPLVHPAFTRDPRTDATKYTSYLPLTRSDTILQSHEWRYVLGKCSDWILPDSPDQRTRDNARAVRAFLAIIWL